MTDLYSLYQTNDEFETTGIWLQISDTTKFKVKRFGGKNSPTIRKLTALYHKPYARMIELNTLPESKEREIYARIFIEACIIDWVGVTDKDGKELEFTKDNAMKLFTDLPELLDTLVNYASDAKNYKEDLGNF